MSIHDAMGAPPPPSVEVWLIPSERNALAIAYLALGDSFMLDNDSVTADIYYGRGSTIAQDDGQYMVAPHGARLLPLLPRELIGLARFIGCLADKALSVRDTAEWSRLEQRRIDLVSIAAESDPQLVSEMEDFAAIRKEVGGYLQ